jgi:hypothetical protein
VFLICIVILASLFFWIKQDVLNNIELAEQKYHAHGEEALISFLEDERNSYYDRTHLAVWTLGKIRSEKALPVLKRYYLNDPKGRSCKGMHHEKICQYELYKAIKAIENGTLLSYASLK